MHFSNLTNTNQALTATTNIVNNINRFYKASGILFFNKESPIKDIGDIFNLIGKNGVCGVDASASTPFLPERHYYTIYINTFGAVSILLAMAPEASYIASWINNVWSGWSKIALTKL